MPFLTEPGEVSRRRAVFYRHGKYRVALKKKSNSSVFGETMVALAEKDPLLVAVSAAMPIGTG